MPDRKCRDPETRPFPETANMALRTKTPPNAIYELLMPGEIRLVSIVPSSLDPAVRVTLRTVPHASVKGNYYCLSYAWGDIEDQMPIKINGVRSVVRCNLYALLRRLRASKRNQDFWIDAICIDQHDLSEKENQVGFMWVSSVFDCISSTHIFSTGSQYTPKQPEFSSVSTTAGRTV